MNFRRRFVQVFPRAPKSGARAASQAALLAAVLLAPATLLMRAPAASAADAAEPGQVAAPQNFSATEKALFMTEHFKALPASPKVLHYHFNKLGTFEAGYEDTVTMDIGAPDAAADHGRTVKMDFLTGTHKVELPTIEGATGNPVIMGFLERDIREMARITGGGGTGGSYYKKRLRMAMVEANSPRQTRVRWGGHDIQAQEFTLQPYKDDPVAKTKYARFANKTYTFVLSDQVPGQVFSIRSVMRDANNNDKIMIDESLTLQENP